MLSEIEIANIERVVGAFIARRRPPVNIRDKLDLGFRINGQSVEIFEIHAAWRGAPTKEIESPVAKTTYVRTQNVWKLYWMRQDLKWHGYDPLPEVRTIEEIVEEIETDPWCCFWG